MAGDTVQKIKDRLSIVDVVASYVELHKAGKNFKGKSPFTNEKTPSFYVSPDRGMYYCFSSSQGGDIFTFIQAMEGVDFKGALKILADKAGVELVPEDPEKRNERDRQYDVIEEATKFFEGKFFKEPEAEKYLNDRGVTSETRAKWRIGYAPGPSKYGWRELKTFLAGKKFDDQELLRAGLIKSAGEGKEAYDVFRDRVMFPICDASGRVVAFSGRILSRDSDAPKYVNSPETELFVKSDVLFGYDKAKEGIRKLNFSLIVEGQFDVVLSHQSGYSNTVAVSGTALTPHHVDLLQRLSNRVVLALDADRAGVAAVKRAADLMLNRSMDVKVARLENDQDPADMIKNDIDGFKKAIKQANHVIEYLLDLIKDETTDERSFKLRIREEVLPYVAKIPNAIDREHFESLVAKKTDTSKEAIHTEVQRLLDTVPVSNDQEIPLKREEISSEAQLHNYSEQIFGALRYLERFSEQIHVPQNIESKMREILDDQFDQFASEMTDDRLNRILMQFEKAFEAYPNKVFFENLAAKLNRFHEMFLKTELSSQTSKMRELEQAGELNEVYDEAMQKARSIQKKLSGHHISETEIMSEKD